MNKCAKLTERLRVSRISSTIYPQTQRVGRALMEKLLDVADNWLMLVRVDLEVFAENERAIKLYESLGFEKEGVIRCASIRNGVCADEYLMSRIRK